jgi:hypothetical protein
LRTFTANGADVAWPRRKFVTSRRIVMDAAPASANAASTAGVTTSLALPRGPSFARLTASWSADASTASADQTNDNARPPLPVDCDESMDRPIS